MFLREIGMVSPVGYTTSASCAAMRAGLSSFAQTVFVDLSGEPIIGAFVPDLDVEIDDPDRFIALLAPALEEVLAKSAVPLESIPLLIGLCESSRPGAEVRIEQFIQRLEKRLNKRVHAQHSKVFANGHVSGFEALQQARDYFQQGVASHCIVAGVDSYLNGSALAWLERQGRLKTANNSNGVIPGECAVAVLVSAATAKPAVAVRGLGFSEEKAHVMSDEPLLGLGLAQAVQKALLDARLEMHEIPWRLSDVTGESYGFKELALATSRSMKKTVPEFPIWHCAEYIGDTGAASGLCQLSVANASFQKIYAPGSRVIGFCSAVEGKRAVVILEHLQGT